MRAVISIRELLADSSDPSLFDQWITSDSAATFDEFVVELDVKRTALWCDKCGCLKAICGRHG